MAFKFNHDYHDLEQVAQFLPAFCEVREEIVGAGRYPYNDDFRGRIPGIEGPSENTAIYLLQGLRRAREMAAKVEQLLAEGYEHVTELDGPTRYRHVIFYPTRRLGGEWQEWRDARLIPEDWEPQREVTGPVRAVLPKGRRTHGVLCMGRAVLVLR